MSRLACVLLLALLSSACASQRYAQFATFVEAEPPEDDPLVGCVRAFTTPTHLEIRCPAALLVVDDRLRDKPYDVVKRWAAEEQKRQEVGLGGHDQAHIRVTVEEVTLPSGDPWPVLRAISLAGADGMTPVEDVRIAHAPYDRDGVREIRCTATTPVGADRCARVLPALLARTPSADLPPADVLLEGCESERFPLHKVRGATRSRCRYVTLIEHDRVRELPAPEHLSRALSVPSGSAKSELIELPSLDDGAPELDVRGFVLTTGGRVVWSGVLGRDPGRDVLTHCATQLPPALGLRHCYRVVVQKLTGDDRLDVTPGG